MVEEGLALPGRDYSIAEPMPHLILGTLHKPPYPSYTSEILLGMGCFWGAERKFWQLEGVYSTAVGYAGGITKNPTYEEVCSGLTGHTEVVSVIYDTNQLSLVDLLRVFWESHDPTQGYRQGNDVGTQYRSAIYYFSEEQHAVIASSKKRFGVALVEAGFSEITTEVSSGKTFYYAEDYHQQYLAKNPNGYCGLRGTGVTQ